MLLWIEGTEKKHNFQFGIFSYMNVLIFVIQNGGIYSTEIFKWGVHVHKPMLKLLWYVNEKDFIVYYLLCCNVWFRYSIIYTFDWNWLCRKNMTPMMMRSIFLSSCHFCGPEQKLLKLLQQRMLYLHFHNQVYALHLIEVSLMLCGISLMIPLCLCSW